MSLIKQLIKEKLIDKKQAAALEGEIKSSGKKPEEVVLKKGIVPEKKLFELKNKDLNKHL